MAKSGEFNLELLPETDSKKLSDNFIDTTPINSKKD